MVIPAVAPLPSNIDDDSRNNYADRFRIWWHSNYVHEVNSQRITFKLADYYYVSCQHPEDCVSILIQLKQLRLSSEYQ